MKQTLVEHKLSRALLLDAALAGLAAGAVAVFYRFALSWAERLWELVTGRAARLGAPGIAAWFVLLALLALLVRRLLLAEPLISGSGIPQFEGEMMGGLDSNWLRVLLCKLAGGVLCVLGGLSLGREGPSVQLGAMAGKGISRATRTGRDHQQLLVTCGAGAGLAAAFNAPLSGVLFALEEVHKSFSSAMLISVMVATTVADCLSKLCFGSRTVFSLPLMEVIPIAGYGLVLLLGLLTGLAGTLYNRATLFTLGMYQRLPGRFRLLPAFLLAGVLGFSLPQVLGGGHRMIELLHGGRPALGVVLLLLLAKFLFSLLSFGSGAPGGIFFPLLVLGAYLGAAFSLVSTSLLGVSPALFNNFVILSMLGLFVAIVRAPITGIVLVIEMTGTLAHLPSLTAVAALSYVTAAALNSEPIYDSLLARILAKRGGAAAPSEA